MVDQWLVKWLLFWLKNLCVNAFVKMNVGGRMADGGWTRVCLTYIYICIYNILLDLVFLLYSCVFVSASCLDNCRDELPAGSAGVASHHWIHCSAGHHADPRNEQKKPIKKPIFWVPPVIIHVDRNFQEPSSDKGVPPWLWNRWFGGPQASALLMQAGLVDDVTRLDGWTLDRRSQKRWSQIGRGMIP